MSEWIDALRRECEKASYRKVADKLGVSPTKVNQVVNGKYPSESGLESLRQRFESAFLKRTVHCPVLGEITIDKCLFHQNREFAATNPQRVMLYRACRSGCGHSKLEQTVKSNQITVRQIEDSPPKKEVVQYDLENNLASIRRKAKGDKARHNTLLETELTKLATRYNQLLWSKKYSRSEK
ncbi:hypothetical protein [Photobacterium marinum]|uniref:hypothetical protein n=1 Tax=Photobacterium marinum TaxID=1056511 RepID=UPI0018DECFA3|nr:hypothetical protein [Photobacterium marinum]